MEPPLLATISQSGRAGCVACFGGDLRFGFRIYGVHGSGFRVWGSGLGVYVVGGDAAKASLVV